MKRTIISIIYMLLMTLDICAQGAEFETAAEAVENMKVGWNLGNTLDAFTTEEWFHPTGWQDYETIWGNPITKPSLMRMMRKAGFNAIRIPVTWFPHMDTTGKIDEVWMKRVHEVVDYVIDQGMYCILNSHHDTSHKDAWLWADKSYYEVQERYKYMWTQIAQEFQYYDEHLLFAGWNEILERQEIFGGDSDKERYNVLNQINQDFVDAVRAVGGKNKSRNLIVAPYYNWCGWGKGTPDYIIKALQALTVPNDEFPGHILFEVHTYFNTSDDKISEVLDGIIEAINTYLVTKGVPVVIGEWGPSNEYDNPTRTDAFARHFMQETHSNRIATFAWNGPLCNGEYRNLPAFEEPSYICGIMKGYYGEEYEPQMLLKNDYDEKGQRIQFVYTIGYDGIGTELNVFEDDVPLKFKNYKGIRIEFAEPVSPDEFHFRFYGDGSDEDLRPVNNGQSTTIDFESLKFNQTINRITLQHTQEGKAEAKLICAWLIRHDGTEEYSDLSPFWGCEIKKIEDYVKPSALSYSYSVNEVIGDKIMRSTTGEESLGTELYVPYRRYNVLNGRLYQKMASGGPKGLEYNHYFTLTTDGQIENIDYEQTDITDVVFLSEAEDIPGMTLCDNDNMRVRSSNSAAAYAADGAVAFVTLPAGSYQLTAFIHDSYKNPDSNWSFLAGDREIANFHCDVVNIQEFHSDVFTLTKETTLYIPQNGGPRNGIDLIYITKQKQVTITANDLTMVYGDDVPTLTFKTEGDELNGTPSLSTTATKTSPVGTYPITVSQGSVMNSNVTYVGGTLTITKAPLTIKAGSYTKKQGEDNPVFALTYDGFKNKETKSVLEKKPTVTCEATKESEPGEYAVKVSDAEAQNYDISYVNGKLVVTQADAVVLTAKSYTRVYGDANPTFEFTTSGATLTGTPQITCEATATSPVGTYDIIISQGSVTNYNVTYVKGTLTITKVPLTVGVQDVTITEGDAIPTFTLTYEGFRNDDTESTAFATKPKATTTATSSSKPGIYPITVSGGDAKNYELSYQAGTLTVKEKEQEPEQPVTITANDLTMVYGDNVPTLTFKTEGDELNGTPSLSTTATKTSPVGTYPITVSQGSVTNSNVIYVAGTLTITKAPLTIKAGSYTKKQGEDNPVFALTYNGFKNNETRSVLTKKPTVTCEATKDSPPGDYEIIVSGAEAQNYDISYQSGWLKIEEAQGIQSVVIDGQPFDVYNIQGRKVRSGITTLKGLPKGVYIINGIKVVL